MSRTRRAFTLVELLVVITIIGILIAMLLPAIYGAIRRARQVSCINNMRQVTIATTGYSIQRGKYPGYLNQQGGRVAPWTVAVIANLGRVDVADIWDDPAVADAALPRVVVSIFQCPANPPAQHTTPQLSYVANAGAASPLPQSLANGVFLDRSAGASALAFTLSNFIDGAASTLLFTENVQATEWHVTQKNDITFVWHPTLTPTTEMRINRGIALPLSENTARPSSRHDGGVNVTFADDHGKYLSENIDYKVYMQLMTPEAKHSDMPPAWKSYFLNAADL
jgi:prepilin-type N-terminal cleavage/methylation domain-containing protein/prepilin-type processing-associated H-X9-DG protein